MIHVSGAAVILLCRRVCVCMYAPYHMSVHTYLKCAYIGWRCELEVEYARARRLIAILGVPESVYCAAPECGGCWLRVGIICDLAVFMRTSLRFLCVYADDAVDLFAIRLPPRVSTFAAWWRDGGPARRDFDPIYVVAPRGFAKLAVALREVTVFTAQRGKKHRFTIYTSIYGWGRSEYVGRLRLNGRGVFGRLRLSGGLRYI